MIHVAIYLSLHVIGSNNLHFDVLPQDGSKRHIGKSTCQEGIPLGNCIASEVPFPGVQQMIQGSVIFPSLPLRHSNFFFQLWRQFDRPAIQMTTGPEATANALSIDKQNPSSPSNKLPLAFPMSGQHSIDQPIRSVCDVSEKLSIFRCRSRKQ